MVAWLLIVVLGIYGVFSSPFPDQYGLAELVIGVLLIIIILSQLPSLLNNIIRSKHSSAALAFSWLLTIPTLIGAFTWEAGDMVRDVVPLGYLFFPLFLVSWCKKNREGRFVISALPLAMMLAGGAFAMRYFTTGGISFEDLERAVFLINLRYYSYDPTVTFTLIYGLLLAISLIRSTSLLKYPQILLFTGVGLLALASLGGIGQRAPIGIAFLMLVVYLAKFSRVSVAPAVVGLGLIVVVFLAFQGVFESFFSILSEKTDAVGINGKIEELELILSILSVSWSKMLFGVGWGGLYYNYLMGGTIRFSHSIVGFYLLKTGIVGLLFLSFYVSWLVKLYLRVFILAWRNDVMTLPLVFAIGSAPMIAMLQPTYKTLSFGLIMSLIPLLYYGMQNQVQNGVQARKFGRVLKQADNLA